MGYTKEVENIYRAMDLYGSAWLDSKPIGVNGTIWKYSAKRVNGNGLDKHMIWSTGGGCIGHGKQGSTWTEMGKGDGVRRIHVIDIDENSPEVQQYLAYAILYSTANVEYCTEPKVESAGKGKEAICNWLKRNQHSLGTFKGQIDCGDGDEPSGYRDFFQKYDQPYGNKLNIGGTYYSNVLEYINARDWSIKLNQTQMNNDKKNGVEPKIYYKKRKIRQQFK